MGPPPGRNEAWADFFAQHRPRRINITLYGADEAAYGRLCHHPGGFEAAVRAIRLLRERRIDVKINGSVTRRNAHEMDAIYALGRELARLLAGAARPSAAGPATP